MFDRPKIKFSPKNAIYPAIVAFWITVIAVLFAAAAGFLAENINKALESGVNVAEENSIKVDLRDFRVIAEKLGLETKISAPE